MTADKLAVYILGRHVETECTKWAEQVRSALRETGHVVLDLSLGDVRPEQVAEYAVGVLRQPCHTWANHVADQIEAQTKPPKPPEPTGLGAVVEDSKGVRWARSGDGAWHDDDGGSVTEFGRIDAVRILSEGWSQ